MRQSMEEVKELLRARIQCIWINTYEEAEAIKDLVKIAREIDSELIIWSHTEGSRKKALQKHEVEGDIDPTTMQPPALFKRIASRQAEQNGKSSIYVLRDLHHTLSHHATNRALRDIKEYPSQTYAPVVVISPVTSIPSELEKLFTVVEYDLPSREEITSIVNSMAQKIKKNVDNGKDYVVPTEEEKDIIIKACLGLTFKEIIDVFAKSLVKYKKLSVEAVSEEKIQLVKKSGVLDYSIPTVSFDDIGGNDLYKEWIEEVKQGFSEEAREFGVALPKGALHVGVAGCSKTLMAEALASKMHVPLIKFQMSKVMSRLVGESEKKMDHAMRVVKAIAPCVLLIDEVEKSLGGISSSNSTDSGTLARVFEILLKFMNDNKDGVFVVMTSNDVSGLPPELTRAGRLDAHWFFTLPTKTEREEIFRIHFRKTGRTVSDEVIVRAAEQAENYTGAEIEEIVKVIMRKAYARFRTDGNREIMPQDIESSVSEVIPLYTSSREKINALNLWAQGRARKTNREEEMNTGFNPKSDASLLDEISRL